MSKIYDFAQYSPEWEQMHLGLPTASQFSKILTAGGKPSKQWEQYVYHLIAERLLGRPVDTYTSPWMERGNMLESDACDYYELKTGSETKLVGFITDDGHTMGCSPDRLVGEDGLLEIKCPKPDTQVKYLITGKLDDDYKPQTQGQLFVSGRKWVDILSYHPELPPCIIRVERDIEFIACLEQQLKEFTGFLDAVMEKIGAVANLKKPDKAHYLTA